jgi:hypothetical protein
MLTDSVLRDHISKRIAELSKFKGFTIEANHYRGGWLKKI